MNSYDNTNSDQNSEIFTLRKDIGKNKTELSGFYFNNSMNYLRNNSRENSKITINQIIKQETKNFLENSDVINDNCEINLENLDDFFENYDSRIMKNFVKNLMNKNSKLKGKFEKEIDFNCDKGIQTEISHIHDEINLKRENKEEFPDVCYLFYFIIFKV